MVKKITLRVILPILMGVVGLWTYNIVSSTEPTGGRQINPAISIGYISSNGQIVQQWMTTEIEHTGYGMVRFRESKSGYWVEIGACNTFIVQP